jgi:outer membrane protein OmpA-like peptidoglycan-associated protein
MRSSLVVATSSALVAAGCAAADTGRVCSPMLSWSAPAYTCTAVAEPPAPEPEPVPEPEPPPPPPPERVEVKEDRIDITEVVQFETGSAVLLPESESLLREVAQAIKDHPEIRKVSIEGHTDARGGTRYNQKLSDDRARSVREFLIAQGVEKNRLSSKGFGKSKPIADNDTEDGMYRNRRVEFKITERAQPEE